jgi:hypothetical protein
MWSLASSATPNTYVLLLTFPPPPVPPSISPFTFCNSLLSVGVFAQLQHVIISGDVPIIMLWVYLNSDLVTTIKDADLVCLLMIGELNAKHTGSYTCIASNFSGRTTFTTPFVINSLS